MRIRPRVVCRIISSIWFLKGLIDDLERSTSLWNLMLLVLSTMLLPAKNTLDIMLKRIQSTFAHVLMLFLICTLMHFSIRKKWRRRKELLLKSLKCIKTFHSIRCRNYSQPRCTAISLQDGVLVVPKRRLVHLLERVC